MKLSNKMLIFSKLVETGSFAGTARALNMARSAVSRHISTLEDELGLQLIYRDTRKLSLTEAGELYYQAAVKVVETVDDIHEKINQLKTHPKGSLRITTCSFFGVNFLAKRLADFQQAYPEFKVELILSDDPRKLINEGIDIAIELGNLPDSSLIAHKLMDIPLVICGGTDYFKQHEAPKNPNELKNHRCIETHRHATSSHWKLKKDDEFFPFDIHASIKTNSELATRSFIYANQGIAILPFILANSGLQNGLLKAVLQDYALPNQSLYIVYPHRKNLPAKIKLFVEFILNARQKSAFVFPDGGEVLGY